MTATDNSKKGDISNEEKDNDNNNKNPLRMIILGKKIADVRKLLNCTQSIFAKALDITPQTLSLIERGKFELTNNLAAKLYFSLYELVKDKNTVALLALLEYQTVAIDSLLCDLREYIANINSDLLSIVNKKMTIKENEYEQKY